MSEANGENVDTLAEVTKDVAYRAWPYGALDGDEVDPGAVQRPACDADLYAILFDRPKPVTRQGS